MIETFKQLDPVLQALLATCFTYLLTAVGAAAVFCFRSVNQKVFDGMLGFAAGVMIAASYWSLLAPALAMAGESTTSPWIPTAAGFLSGGLFLWCIDRVLPHLHLGFPTEEAEGIKTGWHRSILLVLAITLHNVPEGLAVGTAFGALSHDLPSATLSGAVILAVGIGIQNIPEGAAVSVPLHREGFSRRKSFWYGQLSGVVEPLAGVLGALAVSLIKPILPFSLSFAAGAMIFVVVEELIPESQLRKNTDIATVGTMTGFTLMMCLDTALG